MELIPKCTQDEKFEVLDFVKTEIKQECDQDLGTLPAEGLLKDDMLFVDVKQIKVEPEDLVNDDVAKYFINEDDLNELKAIKNEENSIKPYENMGESVLSKPISRRTKRLTSTVCPYCDRQFVSSKNFRKHVASHTTDRRFQCALCNSSFKEKYNLVIHIKTHRGERDIPCPMCDKVFIVRSALKSHMRTHSKEKPYLCNICGKAFSHRASLKPHIATHNEGYLFECEVCGERVRDRKGLLKHMKSHHVDCKIEGCDFCLKFKHSEDAFKHLQKRLWKCAYCTEEFKYYPTYKNHLKIHNNEMFACKFCNKTYLNMSTLKIHMRNHTEETPFECTFCDKKFKRKDSLKYHLTTHSEKRELFRCDVCDQGYTHTSSLFKHKRSAHSITVDRTFVCCRFCGEDLHEKAYRVHMKKHQVLVFKCKKCKEYVEGEDVFETHKKAKCTPIRNGQEKLLENVMLGQARESDNVIGTN